MILNRASRRGLALRLDSWRPIRAVTAPVNGNGLPPTFEHLDYDRQETIFGTKIAVALERPRTERRCRTSSPVL
jgi:hypothetical protein